MRAHACEQAQLDIKYDVNLKYDIFPDVVQMKAGTEQKLQDNEVVTYHVVDVVRDGSMA